MAKHMALGGVEEDAGPSIPQKRIVVPAIPKPGYDVDKFICALVTEAVVLLGVAIEVERGDRGRGGHHVPRSSAAAEMVERGKLPRDVVGLTVTGRCGAGDPDASRPSCQGGQKGQRLEFGD